MEDRGPGEPMWEPSDPDPVRLLLELPDPVVVVDAVGDIQWGNLRAEQLFGRSLQDSRGVSGLEFVHPEDIHFVALSLDSIQHKDVGAPIEIRLRTPSGWRLVELVGSPVPWFAEGCVVLCLRDLTQRRRFELAYDEDARFRSVIQNAAVVTMLVAPDGTVTSCSGALSRMLGHDPELVEGRPLSYLVDSRDRPKLAAALSRAAEGAGSATPVTVTVHLTHYGRPLSVPFELAFVNLVDDPTVGGYIVSGHDVTDRTRLEEELSYQAFHDSLTGLGNRALFLNRLERALERSVGTGEQIAILFLDMDGLKDANDRLGHSAGDALLQSMAGALLASIRRSDTAARLGGDEFAVIVEDFSHPEEVLAVADRILDECRRPMAIGADTVSSTVSMGFTFSTPGISVDELMSNADRAMYTAKDRGKDRYERFEEWMVATAGPSSAR